MGKAKEKAVWREIDGRSGRNSLPEGERPRPYYLGTLIDLETGVEEFPPKCLTGAREDKMYLAERIRTPRR